MQSLQTLKYTWHIISIVYAGYYFTILCAFTGISTIIRSLYHHTWISTYSSITKCNNSPLERKKHRSIHLNRIRLCTNKISGRVRVTFSGSLQYGRAVRPLPVSHAIVNRRSRLEMALLTLIVWEVSSNGFIDCILCDYTGIKNE
jgi:hypothetical protein